MAYTATDITRLKDMKALGTRIKTITDDHASQIKSVNDLAMKQLNCLNALIAKIERNGKL